jgi:hypothetical protein
MIEMVEIKPEVSGPQQADPEITEPIPKAEQKKRKEIADYLQTLVNDEGLEYMDAVDLIGFLDGGALIVSNIDAVPV